MPRPNLYLRTKVGNIILNSKHFKSIFLKKSAKMLSINKITFLLHYGEFKRQAY